MVLYYLRESALRHLEIFFSYCINNQNLDKR